jgi:hypothetical protein
MYRASALFLLPRHSSQHTVHSIVHSTVHSISTSFLSKTTDSIYLLITTSLLLCLFQPFVHPYPYVRLVSVYIGEQSNILILLLQGLVLLALSSCPPLLLKSLLIISPPKTKLRGIKGLLRGVVRKFLLLGNVWILDSSCKILMPYSLVEQRPRNATKLISSTNPSYMSFRIIRYIARNTIILTLMRLF